MKRLLPVLWLSCLSLSGLSAQEVDGEAEPPAEEVSEEPTATNVPPTVNVMDEAVIPQAYDENRYQGTWQSNPFLRKTVVIVGPQVDWSNDWALAGMYRSTTGKITVSLQNKQTGEFKRITSDADENSEFKLITANFNRNRDEASADISKDGKTATVKYDSNLTSKPVTINNTFKAPPAVAGQPGAVGNPNIRPGQPVNATPLQQRPGMPGSVQPGAIQPGPAATVGQPGPAAAPPTISRRRQLIPAPVAPPPAAPQ